VIVAIFGVLPQLSCTKPIPPVPVVSIGGLDSDVQAAIRKARDQAVAQPNDAGASGRFGMVLEAHTLYQPAVLAYQRAIRLDQKNFDWHYYLALSLDLVPQPEQALAAVTEALGIRPDYAPAIVKRGDLLFKLGRFKEADAVLSPLVAKNPSSANALYSLARVKYAEQDFAAAEDLYKRACQAYPTYGAAWYGLAVTARRLGHQADFAAAERYKNDAPQDDRLFAEVLKQATGVETRLAKAKDLMHERQFDEASRLYKEVLKQFPENPDALVNLLYIAQFPHQATPGEVEDLYARAQRIKPPLPQVYMYYGTAVASEGKYDAATAAIHKAIEMKPDFAEAHAWLADVAERRNRPSEAVAEYRLALQAQPTLRPARLELGKLLVAGGQSQEAIPVLLPLLQVEDPYTPVVMMFLAQAYLNAGDRAKAVDYLTQARPRVVKNGPAALLPQIDQGLAVLGARP
jgi:tetratricopeptide (TPR) repeat protein